MEYGDEKTRTIYIYDLATNEVKLLALHLIMSYMFVVHKKASFGLENKETTKVQK